MVDHMETLTSDDAAREAFDTLSGEIGAAFPDDSQARQIYDELSEGALGYYSQDQKRLDLLKSYLSEARRLVEVVRSELNPAAAASVTAADRNHEPGEEAGIVWRFPDASLAVAEGHKSAHYLPV